MSCFTDLEEPPTEEFDLDYTDNLGDDLPGATPHPFIDPITHCKYFRNASALLLCNNITDRLHGSLLILSHLSCCNLAPTHPVVRLDAAYSLVTHYFTPTRIISVM
jgi:hypothetical protein